MQENKIFSQQSLIEYGTFSLDDSIQINKHRNTHNTLGFGYQLIFIKLFNAAPRISPFEIVAEIVNYAAIQLLIDTCNIEIYKNNRKTIATHQLEIIEYLQLVHFDDTTKTKLENFIFNEAQRLEAISLLNVKAIQFLKENCILSPTIDTLRDLLSNQRKRARDHIFYGIQSKLSVQMIDSLNNLLIADNGYSKLEQLRQPPLRASPDSILNLANRLKIIRETGVLDIDLLEINNNYQKILTREIRIYSSSRIKDLMPLRKYTALVCFLHQTYQDTTDFIIESYTKLLNIAYNRATRTVEKEAENKMQKMRIIVKHYEQIRSTINDQNIPDDKLREALYQKFGNILKEDMEATLMNSKSNNIFENITSKFSYFRQFFPTIIETLDLQAEFGGRSDITAAVELLREMNANKKRILPSDAPINFIPQRLRKQIVLNNKIDRHGWECALIFKIRDDLRNSNIAVKNSKRFGRFQDLFMPVVNWHHHKEKFFSHIKLPHDQELVPDYLKARLNQAYDEYLENEKNNPYVKVINKKWKLSKDCSADLPEQKQAALNKLKKWISSHMRRIKLPDLLVEIDNELHFTETFMFPNRQGLRLIEDICDIIVTIMAHGCNIGLYTMSQLVDGVSYEKIKRVTDWQLQDEALRSSLALVVNAISKLSITKSWGEGKTSTSDAHLIRFREKVLQQSYSPRFRDFALAFYTFVADNYAPYHSKPIECNEGEAPHALDGILYNESDLPIEESHTDTRAAAVIMFTAFTWLGTVYNPRIKGIQKHLIFRVDQDKDYASLTPLLKHKNSTINMPAICKQWDRMAHFYASIAHGHVTASVALKRLLSLNSSNEFYNANLQLGRILKTENTLKDMISPERRKKKHRDLLKGEEMHQLARDVSYGNQGKITARDLVAQRNCCSCLTLIMACIVYWQAKEIARIISEHNIDDADLDLSLLEHISPIGWDNITLYGEYIINKNLIRR